MVGSTPRLSCSLSVGLVTEVGNEACLCERLHRSEVGQVDHDGLLGWPITHVGDEAVFAGMRIFHDARVAVDSDDATKISIWVGRVVGSC